MFAKYGPKNMVSWTTCIHIWKSTWCKALHSSRSRSMLQRNRTSLQSTYSFTFSAGSLRPLQAWATKRTRWPRVMLASPICSSLTFFSRTLLCSFSKSSLQYLLVLIVFISTYRLSTSGSNICSAVGVFFSMISLYLHPKILLFFFSTPYFFFNVYIFDNSTTPHSSLRFKATSRGFSPKAS